MKNARELVAMSGDERRNYLEQHQAEITYEWVQAAKGESDDLTEKDPGRALRTSAVTLEAARAQSDLAVLALAHWARGNTLMMCDRPREAVEQFERAIQLYEKAGRDLDVARVQVSRVAAESDRGYPDRALEIAAAARPILEGSPEEQDRERLALLAGNEGIALEFQGDYEAALAAYREAQKITHDVAPDAKVWIACMDQNRALALTKLNRFDEAEAAYHKALEVLEAKDVAAAVVRVYTGLGWLYDRTGHAEQAKRAFDQAREWLAHLSGGESLQEADLTLYELQGQLERAPEIVVAAAARLREAYAGRAPWYEQQAALLEARARLQTGDTAGAHRVCAEVEQSLAGRSLAGLRWRARYLTGRAWEQDGDPAQARARYEEALELVERDQHRIANVELRASALEDKLAVYQALASLLIEEHDYAAAFQVVERSKARALVDALSARLDDIPPHDVDDTQVQNLLRELGELRDDLDRRYWQQTQGLSDTGAERSAAPGADAEMAHLEQTYVEKARELGRLDPGYGTVLGAYVASIADVRQALPPDALLAEYYTTRGHLFVLLFTPDGDISHCPLGEVTEIERLIQQLPYRSYKSPDGQVWISLYDRLVAPWASSLEGVRHLVIVPGGALHYVPFQALRHPETARYLIEDREVSYVPSATLLVLATQARPERRGTALALGYGGGQLPYVQAEMGAIAGTFSGLTMFTGDQASRERLEEFASPADVIHIAAHGDFRPDAPLFSFVALASGRWQVADVYRQRLDASLVTLGACQTGHGRLTGGDRIGFAHALFYAGAQAALVSLWPVHDASTAALMAALYQGIGQGQRKATALRQAQLALLESEQWSDPRYWAPFCLVGADGIVSAAGLARTVRQTVESGQLSPEASQTLLERLDRIIQTYQETGDQDQATGQIAGLVGAFPELESLIESVWEKNLNLKQMVVKVGGAAEEMVRLSSAKKMAEWEAGEDKLPPATTAEPPDENWPISMQSLWKLRESLRKFGREANQLPGGGDDDGH